MAILREALSSRGEPLMTARLEVLPAASVTRLEVRVYRAGEHQHGPDCLPIGQTNGYVACVPLTRPPGLSLRVLPRESDRPD